MANGTTESGGNHVIKPGLRADIMRNLMETKNTLSKQGSIYVGTGVSTQIGPVGDTIEVYQTKELAIGTNDSGKILSVNAASNDLEYRYIGELNFGGAAGVKNFLETYTALFKTGEIIGDSDSLLITIKSGNDEKKVYVEHAETANSANEALSASTASVATQVQMDTNNNITNVKFYTKIYSTLEDFQNDDVIKTAAADGTITQALLAVKESENVITKYIPVMVIPGVSSSNNAYIFDTSSENAQWKKLTSEYFSNGSILKVVYVK